MSIALQNRILALEAELAKVSALAAEMTQLRDELREATTGIESRIDLRAKGLAKRYRTELTHYRNLAAEVLAWKHMLEEGVQNWNRPIEVESPSESAEEHAE